MLMYPIVSIPLHFCPVIFAAFATILLNPFIISFNPILILFIPLSIADIAEFIAEVAILLIPEKAL